MRNYFLAGAFLLSAVTCWGQTVRGSCNAVANGSNVHIQVTCGSNGLSKADAQRLADEYVAILKLLSDGKISFSVLSKKIDSLKRELQQAQVPAQTQACPGGICIQGPSNAPNTINNFGPRELVITDEMCNDLMRQLRLHGLSSGVIDIVYELDAPNGKENAEELTKALSTAGVKSESSWAGLSIAYPGAPRYAGLSIEASDHIEAKALAAALVSAHIVPEEPKIVTLRSPAPTTIMLRRP